MRKYVLVKNTPLYGGGNIKIACGDDHTFIIQNDSVFCCGNNAHGQLGLGDKNDRTVFTPLTQINGSEIKFIACGSVTTYIVRKDNTVLVSGTTNKTSTSTFNVISLPFSGDLIHIRCRATTLGLVFRKDNTDTLVIEGFPLALDGFESRGAYYYKDDFLGKNIKYHINALDFGQDTMCLAMENDTGYEKILTFNKHSKKFLFCAFVLNDSDATVSKSMNPVTQKVVTIGHTLYKSYILLADHSLYVSSNISPLGIPHITSFYNKYQDKIKNLCSSDKQTLMLTPKDTVWLASEHGLEQVFNANKEPTYQLACGNNFNFVISGDVVYAKGSNTKGQLGTNDTIDIKKFTHITLPTITPKPLANFIQNITPKPLANSIQNIAPMPIKVKKKVIPPLIVASVPLSANKVSKISAAVNTKLLDIPPYKSTPPKITLQPSKPYTYNIEDNKITIGKYTFEALSIRTSTSISPSDPRVYVHIESSANKISVVNFMVYKSLSEGFWRGPCEHGPDGIEKGDNYITSSFLHMDLQVYLNFIQPLLETLPSTGHACSLENTNKIGYITYKITNDIKCIEHTKPFLEPLRIKNYKEAAGTNPILKDNISAYLWSLGTKEHEKKMRLLLKENLITPQQKKTNLQAIGVYMSHYLQEVPTEIDIDYGTFVHKIEDMVIHFHVKGKHLRLIDDNNILYLLIYGEYTYAHSKSIYNGTYNTPVILIPCKAKGEVDINEVGLPTEYIDIGMYIYKILDYKTQCNEKGNDRNCSLKYIFIGDLYTNLWPLNNNI